MHELSTKTLVQKEALLAWTKAGCVGSVILPTGTGKTRLGAMAALLKSDDAVKILVITSRIPLLKQWEDTFSEQGVNLSKVTFMCIASAYKVIGHYDLIIIDEVHRALSPEYRAVFKNLTYKFLLCLTATIPHKEEYAALLNVVAPIVFRRSLKDFVDKEEVISPHFVYNLNVGFEPRLKAVYKVFNQKLVKGSMNISSMIKKDAKLSKYSIFDVAKIYSKLKEDTPLVQASKDFWTGMTMRKQAVYSNSEKIKVAAEIIRSAPSDRRFMLFTKSIAFAERVKLAISDSEIYHSDMKKVDRERVLQDYRDRKFRHLIAVDALNEGLDVADVDSAICLSGVSTELVSVQQLGRILRVSEGKNRAIFINLATRETVEQNWVREKTKSLPNFKWIDNVKEIKW